LRRGDHADQIAALEASAFAALGPAPSLVRTVADEGYERPTPVQSK
jgi:hypothetical protein